MGLDMSMHNESLHDHSQHRTLQEVAPGVYREIVLPHDEKSSANLEDGIDNRSVSWAEITHDYLTPSVGGMIESSEEVPYNSKLASEGGV